MQKIQSLFSQVHFHRDLKLLLIIGGLYSLGIFLSNTFVNVFLWKQAGNYITIATYNVAIFFLHLIVCIIAGKMVKKTNRVVVLRLGIVFLSLFFLAVLMLGKNGATYQFLLGSLLGVGSGFFWLAYNVLIFEITEPETRDIFNGIFGVLESLARMMGPVAAGFVIAKMNGYKGYLMIFAVSFVLFLITIACSFFLSRREAKGKYYIQQVLHERKFNQSWKYVLYAHFFQGLREGIYAFVITIWVYLVTNSELSLGMFNLYISGMSFIFYYVVIKLPKKHHKKALLFGSLILYFSLLIILYHLSYTTLVIYAIIVGIAYPILFVPYQSMTYDIIGKARQAKELRVEYIVIREVYLNLGRVISIMLFLIVVSYVDIEKSIPILLILFGTGYLFIYLFLRGIHLYETK